MTRAGLLGGGVAIGMSECDVVQRLGQPNNVNLGQNPNGLRSAILTYSAGPRPGVYRLRGRQTHGNGPGRAAASAGGAKSSSEEKDSEEKTRSAAATSKDW